MRGRDLVAILAGLLLALSFPKFGVAGLAWIAPGLLLFTALGDPPRQRFRRGYLGGLVFYFTSLYWLLLIPFPVGAFFGWLALGAYLSIYPALWVTLCGSVFPQINERETLVACVAGLSQALQARGAIRRAAWALGCAVTWVALELFLSRFLSGFPWNLLGVSQYRVLPLIQIARFTGVYGVSFLVIWFSVALMSSLLLFGAAGRKRFFWGTDVAPPLLVLVLLVCWGGRLILKPDPPGRLLRLALIQPSIPQTLIWDPAQNSARFRKLIALSEQALAQHPEVLIWPEAALPNMLRYDRETFDAVMDLITRYRVWMILGSDDAEPRDNKPDARDTDYFNSAFLLGPEGKLYGLYRKQKLVIFGEYVPLANWLPFVKRIIPAGEGFAAGTRAVPFHLKELHVTTSVLICFEDCFPELARPAVQADTDFLLNLTNNGWFGESAAQWQHAANSVFRAVENDVPMVRCANNGLTCWVDRHGGLHDLYFRGTTDIYGAGVKPVALPIRTDHKAFTFYRTHGDIFAWSCLGMLALFLVTEGIRKDQRPKTKDQRPETKD